jgi:hypothetical protein
MSVRSSFEIPAMWFFRVLGLGSFMEFRKLTPARKFMFSANFFGRAIASARPYPKDSTMMPSSRGDVTSITLDSTVHVKENSR